MFLVIWEQSQVPPRSASLSSVSHWFQGMFLTCDLEARLFTPLWRVSLITTHPSTSSVSPGFSDFMRTEINDHFSGLVIFQNDAELPQICSSDVTWSHNYANLPQICFSNVTWFYNDADVPQICSSDVMWTLGYSSEILNFLLLFCLADHAGPRISTANLNVQVLLANIH